MKFIEYIKTLKSEVENIGLPTSEALKYLNSNEPIIYLCGKSSTGKTTFLNALFNMDKDELFTSTDISTKTEFRFKYNLEEKILKEDKSIINLPQELSARKELFKSLNKEGESYTMLLNQKSLHGITIVDIPGVFDFSRNDNFSNKMIDEANIVYFFSPCMAKISEIEYKLLKSISESGIPIVVLFTMGDITEVDEGITRKTLPKLVEDRLSTCFKGISVSHHQIISSNDFYKGKESHGIDKLQLHINDNCNLYKKISEENRLIKTTRNYIELLESKLSEFKNDSEEFRNLVNRENKLWFETEKRDVKGIKDKAISNIASELRWLHKDGEDRIYGKSYKKIYSKQSKSLEEQKQSFEDSWNEFWIKLNDEIAFININIQILPELKDSLFEQVSIDTDKLKEVMGEKEDSPNKEQKDKDKSDNKESNKKDKMSFADFMELAIDVGININNGLVIYNKWSYLNILKEKLDDIKIELSKKCNFELENRIGKLEELKTKRINEELLRDPSKNKINSHNDVLIKFKAIVNGI